MRLAVLAIVSVVLISAGAGLAIGPPQPPQPITTPTPTTPLPTSGTGLVGFVSRGPIMPRCVPARPCFQPVHVTLRFSQAGSIVAKTTTRLTGTYRIALAPGLYAVSEAPDLGRLRPSLVRVPAGSWKRVNFTISTGLY